MSELAKGTEVLTAGGLIGKITKVTEGAEIVIALNDTTEITINRNYIVSVLPKGSVNLSNLNSKGKTMLNRYPLWKNLMVILVVAIGAFTLSKYLW